ncbi:hypothetical protein L1987_70068 [Smallanthus sonchifolius]|uniref:Uncharacterized protein n=1 Tax=Smallanthus sonchifolius TaxID=185202 RepID=A0ACB9ANA2_9ASTR|nr:hypothetical protein L1987_70068 [Smallanthus sonchifolius]
MTERYSRNEPPPHRRKTPSFSSSLLDSILRSIDETNDGGGLHDDNLNKLHQQFHDHDLMFFASEPKRSNKIHLPQTNLINEEQIPSLRRAIMIDQWMATHKQSNRNGYVSPKRSSELSTDSSSSGTTTSPSTYRSLPNSFTISRKTAEAIFLDDTQKVSPTKLDGKFMKSTKLRAMKIYGDLKKVKQPISPGRRISTFIHSLFASSSSKKAKIDESMPNFRSLKKSRSIKQDTTMTCTSFSRSCMSKKQNSSSVKRSVRFYPANDAVNLDHKSIDERDSMPIPKYERRRFTEKNYNNFMVSNIEEDLFELEIAGGVGTGAYGEELPVFETTDLRKIRI